MVKYIIDNISWDKFKTIVSNRNLYMYELSNRRESYEIISQDNGVMLHCKILKSNTTEILDYETVYKNDILKCFSNNN